MSRQALVTVIVVTLLVGPLTGSASGQVMEPPDHTVASVVLEPGDEPLTDLVYEWQPGRTESLSLELWEHQTVRLGERVMRDFLPVPFRVDASVTVERVDWDGSALVLMTVEDVTVMGDPIGRDGHQLAVDLETLVGVRIRAKLDPKGYLISSVVFDPDEQSDARHPARATAIGQLEHQAMRLPLEPIGVGGVWVETLSKTADAQTQGTETHTKRLTGIAAGGHLLIESSTVVDQPVQELPGEDIGLDEPVTGWGAAEASGSARLDLSRVGPTAWLERSTEHGEVDLPMGEGAVAVVDSTTAVVIVDPGWDHPTRPVLPEPAAPAVRVATDDATAPASPAGIIDVVVHDPGAEPRRVLRYELREGREEHTVATVRTGVRAKVDGEWTPWVGTPTTQVALSSTVSDVREDGSFDIEIVYTDVGVPPGSGQLSPEALTEMEASLSGLVGLRQTVHMDDRGRVLAARTSLPPGADQGLQPGQIDAISRDFVDPLPEEAVGAGAVWEVARETAEDMGFIGYGSNTTTLTELLPDGRLQLEGELHLTADPGPMSIPGLEFVEASLQRFSTVGAFTRTIDLGSVDPVGSSRGISDYAFTVTIGDESQATEMQVSMEFDFEPVGATSASAED